MKYLKPLGLLVLALLFVAEALAIKPGRRYLLKPEDLELNYVERKIEVDSLVTLNSWHLQPLVNKKNITIIISYGDNGNMGTVLAQAASLYDLGYDVALYDYRGFGASTQVSQNLEVLFYKEFADDLAAVHRFYAQLLPGQPVVFMGLSMGTIITTIYLAQYEPKPAVFVYDGFITSIGSTLARIKAAGKDASAPFMDDEYRNYLQVLSEHKGLIFRGDKDKMCKMSEQYASLFTIVDFEGGHNKGFYALTSEGGSTGNIFNNYIDKFIKENR